LDQGREMVHAVIFAVILLDAFNSIALNRDSSNK
jgi:hypothetical protein